MSDKERYLCDEVLLLGDSGEIPEVAFHAALHYLQDDPEGPMLALDAQDLARLREAALKRFRWMILRDLDPGNRKKGIYRGVARSKANWARCKEFCRRQEMAEAVTPLRQEVAEALRAFLVREVAEVAGGAPTALNCCAADLEAFVVELGMVVEDLPVGWQRICPAPEGL
ncbi:MAG: hypothetical protein OEV73_01390 [Desulfobulbaceae bacterium]|nr:hypothetical protein [Desulfobulbaceae bacterium]